MATNNNNSFSSLVPLSLGILIAPAYLYFLITRFKKSPYDLINLACILPIVFFIIAGFALHIQSSNESVELCQKAEDLGRARQCDE